MDKIFEILGVERLDESKQAELKETLKTVIDVKATEIAESKVESLLGEAKTKLKEEYEVKFDEYKDGLTSKFSNFVDSVLDEEMVIPENVIKFARQGELYHELIEQFKTRLAIDEGMISKEVREMLKEAKEEIEGLRVKLDESKGTNLNLEKDASEMAAQLYIREKCDGLTESKKKHVINLLGDEIVKENIDKKFDIIVNTMGLLKEDNDGDNDGDSKENDTDNDATFEMECSECGNKETVKEETDTMKCPECGAEMTPAKDTTNEGKDKGKKKNLNEEKSPWETYKDMWVKSIKGSSE
jgi:predicted RNA-binding Zn-ribbon protein involved in translation (DUF1610 family)